MNNESEKDIVYSLLGTVCKTVEQNAYWLRPVRTFKPREYQTRSQSKLLCRLAS